MAQAGPSPNPPSTPDIEDNTPELATSSTESSTSTSEDATLASSADLTGSSSVDRPSCSTDQPSCSTDQPSFSTDQPSCSSHGAGSSNDIIAEIERKLTEKSEVTYNILLSAADVEHHIRSVCDIGQMLHRAGHWVVLAHLKNRAHIACEYQIDFIPLDASLFEALHNRPNDWICSNIEKFHAQPHREWENWSREDREQLARLVYEFNVTNTAFERVMLRLQKTYDLIIGNFETRYPSTYFADLPFVPVTYMNPLSLHRQGPPPFSGLPTNGDADKAEKYRNAQRNIFEMLTDKLRIWWRSFNIPPLNTDYWWVEEPRELGIYRYPQSLDYTEAECGPKVSDRWMRIDPNWRKFETDHKFKIPRSIEYLPGKTILLSLGHLGQAEADWMEKFLDLLDDIPHRFMYASGSRYVKAPRNVWGSRHLEDPAVLKNVDLVFTHGGNNSLMEIIYHQKPMIVIPFFLDQYDNAQRVVECGIGRRLDTWNISTETIYQTMRETLNDPNIPIRLAEIAEQMKLSDSRLRLRYKIEEICAAYRVRKAERNLD